MEKEFEIGDDVQISKLHTTGHIKSIYWTENTLKQYEVETIRKDNNGWWFSEKMWFFEDDLVYCDCDKTKV